MQKVITYAGVIGLAVSASTSAMADHGHMYLGASAASYYLDSERDPNGGDLESVNLGPQIGYISDDGVGFELGYSKDIGGDDLESISVSLIKMLGEEGGFRPYLLGGLSRFSLDDDIVVDDKTTQIHVGVGLSNMINDNWEIRGDVRAFWESAEDYIDGAVTFGVNYHFVEPAVAAVAAAAPAVAPEPAPEPEKRTITVRLNVEFETNKDVVRAIYGDELEAVAAAMNAHEDIELVLEGHTDSRGSDTYNQDLSDRRAAAVKAKLVKDYSIDASRVSSVGYGESRPIADNETTEGQARNRRVVGEMSYTEIDVSE